MTAPFDQVQPAGILWDENGQPFSALFDDIYFSRDDGYEESKYVFIDQNRLAERWRNLDRKLFTIGETGFGTGLNFLTAAELWLQIAPKYCRLHFVSAEKFPLGIEDLRRALALWPRFARLTDELLGGYPPLTPGRHELLLAEDRIRLTLLLGDASTGLGELIRHLSVGVNAWFLDGFAPAKNPGMWTPELFHSLARLSGEGTTFSTFTAAGSVRRGLTEAGFRVEKVPGYGDKRHMLRGSFFTSSVD